MIARVQTAERETCTADLFATSRSGVARACRDRQPLGWLTISEKMLEHAADLREFAQAARADGLEHAVLLGMGVRASAPEVIRRSYGDVPDGMRLHVLDSTDPARCATPSRRWTWIDALHRLLEVRRHDRTLSHMRYFYRQSGGDGRASAR